MTAKRYTIMKSKKTQLKMTPLKTLIDTFHLLVNGHDCCYLQQNIFKHTSSLQSVIAFTIFTFSYIQRNFYDQFLVLQLAPYLNPSAVMKNVLGMLILRIILFSSFCLVKSNGKQLIFS